MALMEHDSKRMRENTSDFNLIYCQDKELYNNEEVKAGFRRFGRP